ISSPERCFRADMTRTRMQHSCHDLRYHPEYGKEFRMNRRGFLSASLAGISSVASLFASIPFVKSLLPSAKSKALGEPIEVDLAKLRPGEVHPYAYRGRTMLVLRRTEAMLRQLAAAEAYLLDTETQDPSYVQG